MRRSDAIRAIALLQYGCFCTRMVPWARRYRAARGSGHVDRAGALASSLCAVHCVLCAVLPAALGAVGLGFLLGHEAEWGFTVVAIVFAFGALALGWSRHRSVAVALLFAFGIAGLLASRGLEMGHHPDDHGHEVAAESHGHGHAAEGPRPKAPSAGPLRLHHAGAAAGGLGGALLLFGHLLNLRVTRRCRPAGPCP